MILLTVWPKDDFDCRLITDREGASPGVAVQCICDVIATDQTALELCYNLLQQAGTLRISLKVF